MRAGLSTRAYRARRFNDAAGCSEGDGPPCEHGPECEVRYLWPLAGESDDEFVARLTWTYSGRVMETQSHE